MLVAHNFQPDGDPLAPFRDGKEAAQQVDFIVRRAIHDESVSDLPTKSKSRKAMRRWERILSYLENYFYWEMHEHKNQARFHSPEDLLPDRMKMIFRCGKKIGEKEINVRSVGLATADLLAEKHQFSLFEGENTPRTRPVEVLALVADFRQEAFGSGIANVVTLYIAHIVGLNFRKKILECSEIIELGKWNVDESSTGPVDLPPSRPVAPNIIPKPRTSEGTAE